MAAINGGSPAAVSIQVCWGMGQVLGSGIGLGEFASKRQEVTPEWVGAGQVVGQHDGCGEIREGWSQLAHGRERLGTREGEPQGFAVIAACPAKLGRTIAEHAMDHLASAIETALALWIKVEPLQLSFEPRQGFRPMTTSDPATVDRYCSEMLMIVAVAGQTDEVVTLGPGHCRIGACGERTGETLAHAHH